MKHGDRNTNSEYYRLWCIWHDMRQRCNNPNNRDYKYYGGRGITICQDWDSYITFKDWALSHGYNDNLAIDRIDENGDYNSNNCRWATREEQNRNKRTVPKFEYNGEKHILSEWAVIMGISAKTLYNRIHKAKWSIEKALSTPVGGS